MKWGKWLLPLLVAVTFFTTLLVGVWRFGFPENTSTVEVLENFWTYRTDTGEHGNIVLPNVLSLPAGTKEIQLSTTLPEWEKETYALHFVSMEQMVEVWINGEKRYEYGTMPEADDFVYRSAHHINQIILEPEDSGQEITIVYRAPLLFIMELGLLREVKIGTVSDLVLDQFAKSSPYIIISFFAILTTLLSLFVLITYRDMPLRKNLCMFLLAMIVVVFFNSENNFFWSAWHHSPILSALMDWNFYYLDPIVHFAAWLSLYAAGWKFWGICRRLPFVLGMFYIVTAALSLVEIFNFNLIRPLFMAAGFIFTMLLLTNHLKYRQESHIFSGVAAVLLLLLGYYIDYLKYLLMLLPMNTAWTVFLQVKLPFQFFTGIALIIFSLLVLRETLEQLAKQKADMKVESATALLLVEHAKQQYDSIVQRDLSLRSIKHDMQFYFRTVSALLSDGKITEAKQYLSCLGNTVAVTRLSSWCVDYVANITIGWYADQFLQKGIPCSVTADIPSVREEVHVDISCIFSNALQNALEGCMGQSDPFVRLSAKPKGNDLIIRIENRCGKALCSVKQDFPTTKMGEGHGFGLVSMEAAAKRQNGYFKACAKDEVFQVDVVLCGVLAAE